jgi:hypothetical protein
MVLGPPESSVADSGFGYHRLMNCMVFAAYLNGRFFDPVFYAPNDLIFYEPIVEDTIKNIAATGTSVESGTLTGPNGHLNGIAQIGQGANKIGAFLAEYFPARIRYTSVSVPYHIGNGWGGGLVPMITTSAYVASGSLGSALAYPIIVPAVAFVFGLVFMPETRRMSIWTDEPQGEPVPSRSWPPKN